MTLLPAILNIIYGLQVTDSKQVAQPDIVASNFEHNIWVAGTDSKLVPQPDIVASNFEQIYGLQVTD